MAKKSGASRTDTVIKLVLIFFISLLSFSVGTFVGKQVSDADYRRAAIEGDYGSFQATHEGAETEKHEDALTEDDIASLTEEFVNTEKRKIASADSKNHESPAAQEAHPEKDEHKEGYKKFSKAKLSEEMKEKAESQKKLMAAKQSGNASVPHSTVEKAAQRVASGKAPAKDKPEARKPTSVLPSIATSAIGKYTVQVASYAEENEARSHAAELKGKGWNAFYIPAEIKGRTWYRVSVGLFSTSGSAQNFRQELMKEANISSAIIQKIVK